MIRQAHGYLAGAVSGSALIGAAIVAFVVLISLQALRDWPLAGLGGGDSGSVSSGRPAAGGGAPSGVRIAEGAGTATPSTHGPAGRHGEGSTAGNVGLGASPSPSTETPPAEAPTSGGGGNVGGSPGRTPSSAGSVSDHSGDGGRGGSGPQGGSGESAGSGSSGSTSGAVTGAVDETVKGVDEATGGALGEAGVTGVVEETVNGVAGPESPVGKTVDKTTEAVGGLLGGDR
jgi:hypothetical protein